MSICIPRWLIDCSAGFDGEDGGKMGGAGLQRREWAAVPPCNEFTSGENPVISPMIHHRANPPLGAAHFRRASDDADDESHPALLRGGMRHEAAVHPNRPVDPGDETRVVHEWA